MFTFAAAVFFLMITPGPGVMSAAGVGAAHGMSAGSRYINGLFWGNFIVGVAVVSGLAALLIAEPAIRAVLFALSLGYICFLAAKIAFAGSRIAFMSNAPTFWSGVILQVINPKAYAVNTALFTGFGFYPKSYIAEVMLKFMLLNLVWIPIHFIWLWAGITLNRLDLPETTQRRINYAMAASMLAVVALALVAAR